MALTPSTMIPLGTRAPHFELPNFDGHAVSIDQFKGGSGLLVMFISNHCPFVIHLKEALAALGADYAGTLPMVAIGSNDVVKYPADGPDQMAVDAKKFGYSFPYLFDESQAVAKAYRAACTPDFFLFDANLELAYRGQFDGSRPGNDVKIDGSDLRRAIDTMLAGESLSAEQRASIGCNIKWKPGNEPDYFDLG
jgi:peroxiredoxin